MKSEFITYQDGETTLEAYVAYPDSDQPCPAVLIAHAWNGRGEFVCEKARQLAKLGYVGFALDLFGKGVLGQSDEENSRLIAPFLEDRPKIIRRIELGLNQLFQLKMVDHRRIAAIGFCFGGLCVLDWARSGAKFQGVVSFHGLLNPPSKHLPKPIHAKVLALHGHDDPLAPPAMVSSFAEEMDQSQADWQIHIYGNTLHAFTNPEAHNHASGLVYKEGAAQRAWQSMIDFFNEIF